MNSKFSTLRPNLTSVLDQLRMINNDRFQNNENVSGGMVGGGGGGILPGGFFFNFNSLKSPFAGF